MANVTGRILSLWKRLIRTRPSNFVSKHNKHADKQCWIFNAEAFKTQLIVQLLETKNITHFSIFPLQKLLWRWYRNDLSIFLLKHYVVYSQGSPWCLNLGASSCAYQLTAYFIRELTSLDIIWLAISIRILINDEFGKDVGHDQMATDLLHLA